MTIINNYMFGAFIAKEHVIQAWYDDNGQYHRDGGPAIEIENIGRGWFKHGAPHREDGPALELANGTQRWHLHGKVHREDGPAIIHADGRLQWYKNGEFLRENRAALHDMRLCSF